MPTGYTAGIIDGDIENFEQYAKLCMRNFAATYHMRDDPFDAEYRPRLPDNYYACRIKDIEREIDHLKSISDAQLITDIEEQAIKRKARLQDLVERNREADRALNAILTQAVEWHPPTPEHEKFKKFMIDQLVETIDQDCDVVDYLDEISRLSEIPLPDLDEYRFNEIAKRIKEIADLQCDQMRDELMARQSNQWCQAVLDSFEKRDKNG